MIDQAPGFFVLTAFFFALFFAITLLFDRYKNKGKIHSRFKKIPWNTIIKIFCVWVVILVCRKLVYYIPLIRIIQTKDTLIWLEEGVLFSSFAGLFFIPLLAASLLAIRKMKIIDTPEEDKPVNMLENPNLPSVKDDDFPAMVLFISWVLFIAILVDTLWGIEEKTFEKTMILIISAPLVLVKMASSGKYIGLFTGLLAASFILDRHTRYKKIKLPGTKTRVKFFIVPVLVIIGIFISGYSRFTGNWQERMLHGARTAKSIRAYEELVDATNTIRVQNRKSLILKEIALSFAYAGKIKWSQEIFQQAVHSANSIENWEMRSNLLKDISVTIAKTGDIKWAQTIAIRIPDNRMRNSTLKEIRKIGKK